MKRRRSLTISALIALSTLLIGAVVLADEEGGLAASAGRLVGLAALPVAAQAQAEVQTSEPGEANWMVVDRTEFTVGDAKVSSVAIYDSPGAAEPELSMRNPTVEGVRLTFGVLEQQGEWLKVMLPKRPNGSAGWVKASQVKLRKVSNHIQIDVSERKLRAYQGAQVLMEVPVGVGKLRTPTPLTRAYVDISLPFGGPGGAYGVYMLSLAAYSEVLTNFGGGIGQLAIHGTAARQTVGVRSSNGCIRMFNEDVLKLKELAPTGTPVHIFA